MERFTATIRKIGVNPVVNVPARISRKFARRGYVPVTVTLGAATFAANLVPMGDGRHRLYLNQLMRTTAGRETGQRIAVAVALDRASRVLNTPPDLAQALQKKGKLGAFEQIAPSHRKEIIRWLESAKQAATRIRRLARIVAEFPRTPYRG